MSWLNLNQSLNSLKGQITNFATEVLSEGVAKESDHEGSRPGSSDVDIEEKCRNQEAEIAALKKLTEELQASLQSEKLSRKNGVKDEESSWYWDPPPQPSKIDSDMEYQYKLQIRSLQDEISNLKERDTLDLRPNEDGELKRLQEENKNLTTSLEDLDSQHQQAMERLLTLKKELQKNFEVLKQEHEDLKNTNDEYFAEIQDLLNKIGEKDKEIENLQMTKSDYETLHHKYQNLERVHSLLRENAEKFQEENQELHEEVFKLQEQVTKLEHEIELETKHSELSDMVPRERYDDLLKEINDLRDLRNSNQVHLDEINIDDNAKSVIENLKREINELKYKLNQKEIDCQDNLDHKIFKSERIMQLYNKYVDFDLPVDYVGEMPSSGDNIVLYKIESVFKTLNSFKKDIDTLEHKLSEKNLNIHHLQTQIDDVTAENDFLTSDIQHFERELDEMKKNNDFLISEIATLKNTSKLQPIIETHEDNLAKLETELADSNKMNKTFESEIKRIEHELAEVRSEKSLLQESLNDMRNKYTSMLKELDECKTETKAVVELDNTYTRTVDSGKLKQKSDEADELKKLLNLATAKNEKLSNDRHIVENDKVLLAKEIDDLKNKLAERSSEYKELKNLKLILENKFNELSSKFEEVNKLNKKLENEKNRLKEKITIYENDTSTNTSLYTNLSRDKEEESENVLERIKDFNPSGLKKEILELKSREKELLLENNALKNTNSSDLEKLKSYQDTIKDLNTTVIHCETLNKELENLRDTNHKLVEKKLELETELASTDSKIVHLEQEFEKLISDLNEKDTLIDSLNETITQNNISLSVLTKNVTELENINKVKSQELESIKQSFQEVLGKSNRNQEEINRLHSEKEDISKQLIALNDEINFKNSEISNLTNRLDTAEKSVIEFKNSIDNKDKEIKELNQSIVELTDKIKTAENITHANDEYARLVQEKETIETQVVEFRNNLTIREKDISEMKERTDQLERTCTEYKNILDKANEEKSELINLINLKHNESIQYHNEIQRLNHVLLEHTNEFKRIIEEKDLFLQNHSESCSNCERLRLGLKEKDEIIMVLNKNVSDFEKVKSELLIANENVTVLTQKCDNLDKSLAIQLETVKKLTAENLQLSEQEQNSSRELERLRHHLVELEENYTQELMTSEHKLTECQTRLHQVEERAKQSSTVYTSNSIRANQEVETLRNQIKLLEKQREEVQARLSDADDARSRSEAALTNLQVVLEQFQLEKERDIHAATEKLRNKMEDLKHQNSNLNDEIIRLNSKLEESLAGLQAATRLGDQVETKTAQINDLKEQVRTLQVSVAAAEERYYNAISNQQDKVDKNLVKNLVINFVTTAGQNNTNRSQILRLLSTVLDFNQRECEKLGLVRAANTTDSLAAEFVKFLQNESKPRAALPNMMGLAQGSSRSTTPISRKNSTLGPSPNLVEIGHKRNTSTGSNNLLFQNIESAETSSQRSIESDSPRVVSPLDTGVNQTRNTEGAILKYVLKDM